jgi:outer membrane receptor protein involved in Fe transport
MPIFRRSSDRPRLERHDDNIAALLQFGESIMQGSKVNSSRRALCIVMMGIPIAAWGQTSGSLPDENGLAEITVTAQKRSQNLQDVPIAITAFSEDALRGKGITNQNLLDVDHAEILKRPQGTLFGRDTIGGAISIVTRTPGDEFALQGQATAGSFNRRDVSLTADIPLAPTALSTIT